MKSSDRWGRGVGVCEDCKGGQGALRRARAMVYDCDLRQQSGKGIKYRHTWNIVRIGGQYYHLDATFDNSLTRGAQEDAECRYDYFNLDDKAMFHDHEPLIAPAPVCTGQWIFYYRRKEAPFTKMEGGQKAREER